MAAAAKTYPDRCARHATSKVAPMCAQCIAASQKAHAAAEAAAAEGPAVNPRNCEAHKYDAVAPMCAQCIAASQAYSAKHKPQQQQQQAVAQAPVLQQPVQHAAAPAGGAAAVGAGANTTTTAKKDPNKCARHQDGGRAGKCADCIIAAQAHYDATKTDAQKAEEKAFLQSKATKSSKLKNCCVECEGSAMSQGFSTTCACGGERWSHEKTCSACAEANGACQFCTRKFKSFFGLFG